MKLRLIANGATPWERWIRRWGVSFLIDDDILFDAFGDARTLQGNLRRFCVDISRIEYVVISHEHWDHINGLRPLLLENPGLKIYLPAHADPALKNKIRAWGGEVVDVTAPVRLKEYVYASGEIMGRYDDQDMPEQALVLETAKGLVVLVGCAHPGIVGIVSRVRKHFGKRVYAIVGGFHLKDSLLEDMILEAERLKAAGAEMVVPLHCTGAMAVKVFRQVFGSCCLVAREGQEISLE